MFAIFARWKYLKCYTPKTSNISHYGEFYFIMRLFHSQIILLGFLIIAPAPTISCTLFFASRRCDRGRRHAPWHVGTTRAAPGQCKHSLYPGQQCLNSHMRTCSLAGTELSGVPAAYRYGMPPWKLPWLQLLPYFCCHCILDYRRTLLVMYLLLHRDKY